MIRFSSVSKLYSGKIPALADISVEIPDGEFVFLIGPSGSGKTTFLRLLIRDLVATHGIVTVDTVNINTLSSSKIYELRRKVGIVFQDFKLLADRTVYENVSIPLEIVGKHGRDIELGVGNVLDLVGLAKKRNSFPRELSAGEMQRTSIARAIVGGPKILLADEPTGNLDPETSWEIMDIFEQIHSLGTTVIVASHNVEAVNALKKRTITLNRGVIVRDEKQGGYHTTKHEKKSLKGEKPHEDY
jgi:cell division transport system ATP-binding protein